jgi:chemotaxis protein methyltransferase CheR
VGPQDVKQLFDNALELARSVQYDKALTLLDAAIAKENTFEKAYCLKGSLLISASRYDEARSVCALILEKNSLCREAYLILGMIERHHGNSEGAFKRFREALYLDSSCWLAHFYTGEILFAQRDSKRARNSYEAALKILENGSLKELGQTFFPLSFNAEQFIVICRHKLSLLKEN